MTADLMNEIAEYNLQHNQEVAVLMRLFAGIWKHGTRSGVINCLTASIGV